MRAIALTDSGAALLDGFPEPSPRPDQLLVRVLAVGLCGTDVTLASGRRGVPFKPWVLGHEAVGQVLAVGADVVGWHPNDIAVLEPNLPCLTCPTCRRGFTSACAQRGSAGVKTQPGFMAERVAQPAEFAFKAPAGVPLEALVCTEPMAVARAAVRRSGIAPGASALIIGAGAQGLFAAQLLVASGVTPAITDVRADRIELATQHGAVDAASDQRTYDYVFDAAGAPLALKSVLARLNAGARIMCVGESHEPMAISTQELVQAQLTLTGSFIYDHPGDFEATLNDIASGRVHPEAVLAEPFDLADSVSWLMQPSGAGKAWVDLR